MEVIRIELGSKTALLTSNRVMTKRLDHLLHQNAIWSKAVNPFQLTFSPHDSKNVRSTITSLGVLVQNGKRKFTPTNRSVFPQGKNLPKGNPSLFQSLVFQNPPMGSINANPLKQNQMITFNRQFYSIQVMITVLYVVVVVNWSVAMNVHESITSTVMFLH